jgi:TonB family protein
MKIFFLGALFIGLCATQVPAQIDTLSGKYKLNGVVKNQDGAVFSGLNLYVLKGNDSRTFSTNINGEFEMDLQPGDYEVTVNKIYSDRFKAFIKIQENGLNPNDLAFVVDSTRICCNDASGKPYPKPISLPKPPYPPPASATRTSGVVIILVKIGQDGKVISAEVKTGHPLLRASALAKAKGAVFEPSECSTEREAILVYAYLEPVEEKSEVKRYKNPYRIEIIGQNIETYTSY